MLIKRNRQIASPAVRRLLKPFTSKERYHKAGDIGEGGLSKVISSFDRCLNRIVAVKELKEENLSDPDFLNAFITEARMISYLDHPGVVTVYDSHLTENQQLCYTMQVVNGETLLDFLARNMQPDVVNENYLSEVLNIFTKLCETLSYVHDKGVIHLDLKPENIMLGHYGEVMIMDWGNAFLYDASVYENHFREFLEAGSEVNIQLEAGAAILGSPLYMSPEQTRSRSGLGPTSDIYSLGVVLYELLTGHRPFAAAEVDDIVENVRTLVPPPIHELNPDVPLRLSRIVEMMMQKAPGDRPQSAREVLNEIQAAQTSGQAFPEWKISAGQVIFHEGDSGDFTIRIKSGKVEISKEDGGTRTVLAELGPGDVLGELAVFSDIPRTATATALEDTVVYLMRSEEVNAELEKLSPWVSQMITALSHRFDSLNKSVMELEKGNPSP
ncbi:protein kinase [Verrucomicrobiales bacterium BCK34]|nr:protein kinase [Verrucomicrobiales bacterium BCK34]